MNKIKSILIPLGLILCIGCSTLDPHAGGSSQQGNGVVVGKVVDQSGSPVGNAVVKLYPADFNPVSGAVLPDSCIDTTDSLGNFLLRVPDSSLIYQLYASNALETANALSSDVPILGDTTHVTDVVVSASGAVKVMLPDNINTVDGYVYIPGTDIFAYLLGQTGFVILDSIPAGVVPSIAYSVLNSSTSTIIRNDIPVTSGDTATVYNPAWRYAKRLILNTTSSGADVAGNVYDFPVLVRLNSSNFDFTHAQSSGADIRFTKSDNTFLNYEIERWDEVNQVAEIWVRVDTVLGNDSMQSIMICWGNPGAADSSNSAAVFDTADGFQGVWHLGQPGNTTALDATGNHYNGTPSGMSAASAVEGMIGMAQQFNGTTSFFNLAETASSKLSFPENGTYTLSAWVYATAIDSQAHYIISKSTWNYNLDLSAYNFWEIYDYRRDAGWESIFVSPTAGVWKYLTGVRNGTDMRLYIDGECMDTTIDIAPPDTIDRNSTFNVQIGKRSDCDYGYWSGMIDEVNAVNVSRNPDWIKLCYMNQKKQDALVLFK